MMMMIMIKTWYIVTDGCWKKHDGNPESFVLLSLFSKLVDRIVLAQIMV